MTSKLLRLVRSINDDVPRNAKLVVVGVAGVNLLVWIVVVIVLVSLKRTALLGTAALAYSLGLRHALDADHISAIDLVVRRLSLTSPPIPAHAVGTFFSLGHSTIVVITSAVVAITSAGISTRFGGFGKVGGVVGTSVSAVFLLVLGGFNVWTLFRIGRGLKRYMDGEDVEDGKAVEMNGLVGRLCRRLFVLIDRPWKIYPLGILFGLGFDTSSEIALLGISSLQAAKGTGIWLIMIFPVVFTCGMCLLDTIDGVGMMLLYGRSGDGEGGGRSPVKYLYYSAILTGLTTIIALIIGTIQLLSLVVNIRDPHGSFWDGVRKAGDAFDVIGGGIVGLFVVVGAGSVCGWKNCERWIEGRREASLARRAKEELDDGIALSRIERRSRDDHGELDRDEVKDNMSIDA